MVRRSKAGIVRRIKQLVKDGAFLFTEHVIEEMDDDGFEVEDVLNAVRRGRLREKQTSDPRGPRYVFRGPALDQRKMEVVARLIRDRVRILTVYSIE